MTGAWLSATRRDSYTATPCKKYLLRIANIGIGSPSRRFKESHSLAPSTHCQLIVNRCGIGAAFCPVARAADRKGQSVCKPGSVSGFPPDDHSSGTAVAGRLMQPTRTTSPKTGRAYARVVPIRSCSRWGLPCQSRCRACGGLLHHLFTLTPARRGGSISVALSLRSPSPGVTRHRVFVEPGLSSRTGFRPLSARSSDRLAWSRVACPCRKVKRRAIACRRLARLRSSLGHGF